jgi:tRNA(Ile)-lysidine synthetase-like protein
MQALEHRVLAYIKQHQLITKGDKLLVACSGGVDSMALLSFLYRFKSYFQIELAAVHVDHMLRGEASAEDRRFVEEICGKWGVPVFSCAISIPTFLQDEGGNSQAICRRERYRYFENIMSEYKFNKLVTAHHADDQLESLLMAITKASSLNGLKGILAKRPFGKQFIIRPFLAVTKSEIGEYLHNERLTYREDASNQKDAYTRNRFRHHVVPLLKQENHAVSQHVVEIAQQLADDDFYLMGLAQKRFSELFEKLAQNCYKVNVSYFQSEPLALQRRLILILLSYLYNDSNTIQSYTLCTTILTLFETSEGSRSLDLPENFIARRQYEIIVFEQKQQSTPMDKQQLALNKWVTIENMRLFVGQLANCDEAILARYPSYYFTGSAVEFPLYVRTSKPGDRIALYGMQHKKKVSRIFIDDKIPLAKRANWPLLVDAMDDLLAIVAVRTNDKFSSVKSSAHDFVLIVDSDERF